MSRQPPIRTTPATAELLDKRQRDSKVFEIDARRGKYRWSRRRFCHYQRDGQWLDVNKSSRIDRGDYLIDEAPYALRIARNRPAYRYTNGTKTVSVALVGVNKTTERPEDTKYQWTDVGLDTDWEVYPLNFGVASYLVLRSAAAPRQWTWEVLGDVDLLRPITGKDAKGRYCEIEVERVGDMLTAVWTGRVTTRNLLRQGVGWTTDVEYPVRIDPTVNEAISAGADDAWSRASGGFVSTGSIVNAGWYQTGTLNSELWGGFRFQTIGIPNGATIDSATLTLTLSSRFGSPSLRIYADDVDDAPAFATTSRVKNITKTTAFKAWAPTAASGTQALDVQSIIQEIVDRGGWASNNDIRFGLFDQVGSGLNLAQIVAYEAPGSEEAQLDIDYTAAASSVVRTPAAADLVLSSVAPQVVASVNVYCDPAAADLVLSGQAPDFVVDIRRASATADLELSSAAPAVSATENSRLAPPVGVLALSSTAPAAALSDNATATPASAQVALSAQAPDLAVDTRHTPAAADLALSSSAPAVSVTESASLAPPVGVLALSPTAPAAALSDYVDLSPASADLAFSAVAPSAETTVGISKGIPSRDLTLSSVAPAVDATAAWSVAPAAVELLLTAQAPSIIVDTSRQPVQGGLGLSAAAPVVTATADWSIEISARELTLSSVAPGVAADDSHTQAPAAAALALSTSAPSVRATLSASPSAAQAVLSAVAPTVATTADIFINPAAADLRFITTAPTVTETGQDFNYEPPVGALIFTATAPTIVRSLSDSIRIAVVADEVRSGSVPAEVRSGSVPSAN